MVLQVLLLQVIQGLDNVVADAQTLALAAPAHGARWSNPVVGLTPSFGSGKPGSQSDLSDMGVRENVCNSWQPWLATPGVCMCHQISASNQNECMHLYNGGLAERFL